ncbi:hypothetical protein Acsp04_60450 [Actinomadura sp. NBRC 104425]|nr:hypothetical protein Acsp04_60450 [Actinomadura sp. NBRC 104425]
MLPELPDLPQVRSVVDWVARRLAIDWLPFHERAQLGIFTMDERVDQASDWMAREDAALSRSQVPTGTKQPGADVDLTAFRNDMASGIGVPAQPHR